MKKVQEYIKSIETRNGMINCIVKVDLSNKERIFCSFYPSEGKKLMSNYYKIVLPAKLVEGINFGELLDKDITYMKESGTRSSLRSDSIKKQQPNLVEQSIYITPKELIGQLKVVLKQERFIKEKQEMLALSKKQHWDFTKLQVSWILQVNKAIGENNKEIKPAVALLRWNPTKGCVTKGQALLEEKVILFNQNYFLSYDEKTFKQLYIHELAHHYNYEKFGTLGQDGHNASWINIEYDLNKKVFGDEDAKFILAKDLYRYGTNKVTYRYNQPDISEYWEMKDQESLSFVAQKNGWKLESNNELIVKLNKFNNFPTVGDYLLKNKDKFEKYDAWQPMNKKQNGLSDVPFERFVQEITRESNSDEQSIDSVEKEENRYNNINKG